MNDVFFYWNECSNYFNELLELRKKELYIGETEKGTMDLLGMPSIPSRLQKLIGQAQ